MLLTGSGGVGSQSEAGGLCHGVDEDLSHRSVNCRRSLIRDRRINSLDAIHLLIHRFARHQAIREILQSSIEVIGVLKDPLRIAELCTTTSRQEIIHACGSLLSRLRRCVVLIELQLFLTDNFINMSQSRDDLVVLQLWCVGGSCRDNAAFCLLQQRLKSLDGIAIKDGIRGIKLSLFVAGSKPSTRSCTPYSCDRT